MFVFDKHTALVVLDVQEKVLFSGHSSFRSIEITDTLPRKVVPYINALQKEVLGAGGRSIFIRDHNPFDFCLGLELQGLMFYNDFHSSNGKNSLVSKTNMNNKSISLVEFLEKDRTINKLVIAGSPLETTVAKFAREAVRLGYMTMIDMDGVIVQHPETKDELIQQLVHDFVMVLE